MGIFRTEFAGAGMAGLAAGAPATEDGPPRARAGPAASKPPVVARNFLRLTECEPVALRMDNASL
jgi:hypothetical protein